MVSSRAIPRASHTFVEARLRTRIFWNPLELRSNADDAALDDSYVNSVDVRVFAFEIARIDRYDIPY